MSPLSVLLPLVLVLPSAISFAFVSPSSLQLRAYAPLRSSPNDGEAAPTIYDRLGFSEDAVAKGLDAGQVLEHLGTRDDLVAKFLKDNKKFDQAKAEEEVDKFMMDREMVEKYIAWEIKKKAPDFQRNARDEAFSDPSVIGLYAAWLVGGAGLAYFKNVIAAPKFASGEWEPLHIPVPSWLPGQQPREAMEAVTSLGDAFHHHVGAGHFLG
mmetsp:Transcript_4388/g.9125  ORF Transcript_4388/g.9125 Transcript_4388/m.9125 type:complete len:211 (-) Transcript_4388:102-734(-)